MSFCIRSGHRCKEVQQLSSKWEDMGLYIFFLPKYCSEMNPIELEWQHLKKDELAAKTFEDEYYHCLCRH
ncbi:transposase [Nostocales cyanobacterium LEGE 12452]|nr:transposase [Nostocales cyanobacterium LEGE 12452]